MDILMQVALLILGFAMLVKGSDWFVEGTSKIAERFGIPQLVIGLTIVAMGTSAPEAAVSITAALKGNAGITIGNVVGSNILNILIILGLTGVITSVGIAKSTLICEIPYMLFITVALLLMGMSGASVTFTEGIFLWVLFALYLLYLFFMAKKGSTILKKEGEGDPKNLMAVTQNGTQEVAAMEKNAQKQTGKNKPGESLLKLLLFAVVGGFLIVGGSSVTVDSASYLAGLLGFSERLIGLTIVALGTSLPELFTSVTAARKGKADIAIGNIVGSNIFNILFVIGTTALITPVVFEPKFVIDTVISIGAGALLWLSVLKTRELRRPWGVVMLLSYGAYFVYLIA